jgi:hypothetical protein
MNAPRATAVSTTTALLALLAAAPLTGCWFRVETYCPGCVVVDHARTRVPQVAATTHTVVVLVHGSWGFGPEWKDVVDAARNSPGFDLIAWSWPGPFRDPPGDAVALRAELQALLDELPPSVDEIIVLAHSAAGLLANLAVRQIVVPNGRHLTVALLDPALSPALADPVEYPRLPPGVAMRAFFARDPAGPATPRETDAAHGGDVPWQFVGNVGHDPMVAKVALQILAARREARASMPAR